MGSSEGDWHETLRAESPAAGTSDKSFGRLFATLCAALGGLALWHHRGSAIAWFAAAALLALVAEFAHPLLGPFNRVWRRLSLLLFKLVNPVVMGIVFFAVLTPVALIARTLGKDSLRLSFDASSASYWVPRESTPAQPQSMHRQF